MRIVAEIAARDGIKITIMNWNAKYLAKYEQGPLEQTYKFVASDVGNDAAMNALATSEVFLKKIDQTFASMRETFTQIYPE